MKNPPLHLMLPALMSLGVALGISCTGWQAGTGADTASGFARGGGGRFVLRSPAVADGGALPVEFTGDGTGSTLPLEWTGAPPETRSYAVIMHHMDPQGLTKWYWTLYNIPACIHALSKNTKDIGTLGNNSVNHKIGYAPPHSKGPGSKTYVLTVYALSSPVQISVPPVEVSRNVLLAAMKDLVLDSVELKFTCDRTAFIERADSGRPLDGSGHDRPNP
jgi:phosphatidylethanolamine-binding protein (PEBP) family uncharacterized protein